MLDSTEDMESMAALIAPETARWKASSWDMSLAGVSPLGGEGEREGPGERSWDMMGKQEYSL